jgi:hypothetical protein
MGRDGRFSDQEFLKLTAAHLHAQRDALQRLREMVEAAEVFSMHERVRRSKTILDQRSSRRRASSRVGIRLTRHVRP